MKKERRARGWMDLVALIALLGLGYLAIAFSLGTLKPIGAVVSGSMEPALSRGDLVILRNVAPADLRVGDIVQVEIPRAFQEQLGLPPNTLHRIVDIQQTGTNVQFITKGDANSNLDPIPVAPDRVGGVVVGDVPHIGHLFLFLNSPQGRVFALVMAISVIGYILYIGVSDNWRNVVVAAQSGAGTLPAETPVARERGPGVQPDIEPVTAEISPPEALTGGPAAPANVAPATAPADLRLVAGVPDERLENIETGIHETRDSLKHFSAAIAEYGTHLQSHTATVRAMSTASQRLVEAVDRQNVVLERLESTLDRRADAPDPTPAERRNTRHSRRGDAGNDSGRRVTGATERPRTTRQAAPVDASVDDPASATFVDRARGPRRDKRRRESRAANFRDALQNVSARRQPRQGGRGR